MADTVEQMDNRLEAFSLGVDRAAIDCAIRAAEELTVQRDGLLEVAQSILADDLLQYLPAEYIARVRAAIDRTTGGES